MATEHNDLSGADNHLSLLTRPTGPARTPDSTYSRKLVHARPCLRLVSIPLVLDATADMAVKSSGFSERKTVDFTATCEPFS